jgi:hypothetical protein
MSDKAVESDAVESDKVTEFVLARRRGVLLGAIDDLVRSDRADLLPTAHRLRGTLGTFGLGEAERVMSALEHSLDRQVTGGGSVTTLRQTAIDGLRFCLNALPAPGAE